MIVTQTAQYALRVLAYMTTRPENEPVRSQDLSEETGIPSHYLSKIMRRLVEAGLLHSQKGHGGGFRFARPLDEIRFLDVLEAMDVEVEPKACVFGWGACSGDNPCPLHPFWSDLKTHFVDWAEQYTMADVKADGKLDVL